jgi:hypothetical protein
MTDKLHRCEQLGDQRHHPDQIPALILAVPLEARACAPVDAENLIRPGYSYLITKP